MDPRLLKVGDIVTCDTMPGFLGLVEQILQTTIPPSRSITFKALAPYTNCYGDEREKGNRFSKEEQAEGWHHYYLKKKEYLVFKNPQIKEG